MLSPLLALLAAPALAPPPAPAPRAPQETFPEREPDAKAKAGEVFAWRARSGLAYAWWLPEGP